MKVLPFTIPAADMVAFGEECQFFADGENTFAAT